MGRPVSTGAKLSGAGVPGSEMLLKLWPSGEHWGRAEWRLGTRKTTQESPSGGMVLLHFWTVSVKDHRLNHSFSCASPQEEPLPVFRGPMLHWTLVTRLEKDVMMQGCFE